jgi:NADH dehydrogenase [ubiquinone] 1 alpha subcomplex assembly factor 7
MERLDAFMARANAAYYATHDPFADFTTAPEITQVFGELLGVWAGATWRMMGAPVPVIFCEAGPGRGTLMADALRAITQVVPDFGRALHLHFVESSARLRALVATRFPTARWHTRIEDVPDGPLLLLANEFFDALPIRQFVRRADGWAERFVQAGTFIEVPGAEPPCDAPLGAIVEVSEPARAIARALGARLARRGGAALILDYGTDAPVTGDSLQALRAGRPADPLADPGEADLTAHVDFAALAAAARAAGAASWGPVAQGKFLAALGLFRRTDALARANPDRALALIDAAQRLAEPGRMGRLFKALALCHPALPAPPGFAA